VQDQKGFHTIFDFFKKAEEKSGEILASVADSISIYNVDEFKSVVGRNASLLLRLKNASERDELKGRDMNLLEKMAREFSLDIEFTGDEDNRRIVFKRAHVRQIIDLLDDSLLSSDQTELRYAVTGKRVAG